MRVLLIAANTERGNMIAMPLGAGLVAAAARRAGHDVRFLDLLHAADPRAAVVDAVGEFAPEAVGISVRNIDDQNREQPRFLLEQVKPIVDACRASRAPVILGGPGYSIFPDAALRYLGADYGIEGEGEEAFVELLRRLESGEDPSEFPGLHSANVSFAALHRGELDRFPLWDDVLTESARAAGDDVWIPLQTRRGCPNDCSYCSTSAIQGRVIRTRSPESAVEEIRRIAAAGFRRFYFVDNSFNIPESHALKLCSLLEDAALDIEWRCILYPQYVGEHLVAAMSRARCVEVSLGFESGNPAVLREMNKRYTPDEVRDTCALLARYGIRRLGFLMFGGPGETRESVEESLAFAESLHLDSLRTTVGIRIYPHTELARRAVAEGVIAADDDLLEPKFYLAPGLEPWIHERVSAGLSG
ncbi:MAG: B12-binding domain-containing radical SAM protein [Thermoanaerobaculia bacterium]